MEDSSDRAVPEGDENSGRSYSLDAHLPSADTRGSGSQRRADPPAGLVIFKKAEAGSARQPPPRFELLFAYGSHAALAACLFGFAWAAGSYFSGDHSPLNILKPPLARTVAPQDSAERSEMLRTTQKMAEDVRSLKANVEVLRAAQSQTAKDTAGLEGLKSRLDAAKTETGASIAELAGKVERMQREPEAKLSQIIERLDRLEHQIAAPLASGSMGAPPALGPAAARKQVQGGRGDAFDPSQNPTAPGVPRSLGSLAPAASTNSAGGHLPPLESPNGQRNPQLITNWVVRDVYDGIALVESPRGSIEVMAGETIPGAGTVKSIERRGAGWIVITSRGLVDSAHDGFQP